MFIEKIKTPGLAHLSYFVSSEGQAFVIDPRRDIDVYLETARAQDCRITHIFETHRNEDLISGSAALSNVTGAKVFHGPNADGEVTFATTTKEGECFEIGNIKLSVLETPGHTKDSLSFLLIDKDFDQSPAAIFTGDALFVGDVGRTDFYPDEAEHVAGQLYDSLQKIRREAGDAALYPAHGAGSVCGDGMADREFSTVAHEFTNNPMLQLDSREAFVEKKVAEFHYQAPYFKLMERLNLEGAEPKTEQVPSLKWPEIKKLRDKENIVLLDVRSPEAFAGGHIPGSVGIPVAMLTAYAGWLFHWEDAFVLITDATSQVDDAICHLRRIGYDNIRGFYVASMPAHAASGEPVEHIALAHPDDVHALVNGEGPGVLIDVRKKPEFEEEHIKGAQHHFLGKLRDEAPQLDKDAPAIVMCKSGKRATVGAGVLKYMGFQNVRIFIGSMGAWKAADYPVES